MDALRGIGLLFKTPRLWPLAIGPLFGAFLAYAVLGVVGAKLLIPRLEAALSQLPGGGVVASLGEAAALVVYVLLFPFVFVLLGGVFFGLVFEPLSKAVERTVAPDATPPNIPLGCGATLSDTTGRLFLNASLGLAALILATFLGPLAPVPGVLAAALIGILDYTSPAYLRRGLTLRSQANRLLRPPDASTLSFGLVAGLLSLVPFLGVLCMPGLIAGGTLLALRRESSS